MKDKVLIRSSASSEEKWVEDKVLEELGKVDYLVNDHDGKEMKRHID